MSIIKFNATQVSPIIAKFSSLATETNAEETDVKSVISNVPSKVLARRNIQQRLLKLSQEIHKSEKSLIKLKEFTAFSLEQYTQAEFQVKNHIKHAMENGLIAKVPMKTDTDNDTLEGLIKKIPGVVKNAEFYEGLKKIYENISVIPGIYSMGVAFGGRALAQVVFDKIGYVSNIHNRKLYINLKDFKIGKYVISPLNILKKVDDFKFAQIVKSHTFGLYYRFKYANRTISELIPKKLTGIFTDDHLNLKNMSKTFADAIPAGFGSAVKNHGLDLFKAAKPLLKSNILTGIALEGIGGVISGSLQIKANNLKWANDEQKRVYENKKVIRTETVGVIGAGVGGGIGAVIGGTLGSAMGPAGTIIGAAVGGGVGSFIGKTVGDFTNKGLDFVSKKLFDPHGERKAVKFADTISEGAKGLMNSAKGMFGKLKFG